MIEPSMKKPHPDTMTKVIFEGSTKSDELDKELERLRSKELGHPGNGQAGTAQA